MNEYIDSMLKEVNRFYRGDEDLLRKRNEVALRHFDRIYDDLTDGERIMVDKKVRRQGLVPPAADLLANKNSDIVERLNSLVAEQGTYEDLSGGAAEAICAKVASEFNEPIESVISLLSGTRRGSSRKGEVYRLDDGRVVDEKTANEYKDNYKNMMDAAWEEHKRKGGRPGCISELSRDITSGLRRGL